MEKEELEKELKKKIGKEYEVGMIGGRTIFDKKLVEHRVVGIYYGEYSVELIVEEELITGFTIVENMGAGRIRPIRTKKEKRNER